MSSGYISPVSAQRGITIVEVMVTMAIGLILLVALGTMLVGSLKSFKVQDAFSRMQESGAFALNAIGNDIRMAGFYGQIGSFDITMATGEPADPVGSAGGTDCGTGWSVQISQPVLGVVGSTAAAASAAYPCIVSANFLGGSPILILRGATGIPTLADDLPDDDSLYVQSTPGRGILFRAQSLRDVSATNRLLDPWLVRTDDASGNTVPALIYPYQAKMYYVRPCSRPSGSGGAQCTATDDDGQPIPTLVRQELVGLSMVEQPVAEGVERFSLLYGIDTDNDGAANRYVAANLVTNWLEVTSIRVAMLIRSPVITKGYNDSNKSYDLGDGAAAFTCTAGVNCGYHRHVFSQTFQLRNLSQRREI